jgi:hypothetical protein
MTSHPRTLLAIAIPVVALVAGCGSSGSKAPAATAPISSGVVGSAAPTGSAPTGAAPTSAAATAAGTPNPCTLLTAADISKVLGGTVGAGTETDGPAPLGGKSCNWSGVTSTGVLDFEVSIRSDSDITVSGETASSLFTQTTTTFPGLTEASGIGDKAFFSKTMGYILAKGLYIATVADIGGTADSGAQNKTLATMVVAKL